MTHYKLLRLKTLNSKNAIMKKTSLFKFGLLGLLGAFMMVSCGDDDDPIINNPGGGDGLNVQDGLFMTIAGEDPSSLAVMEAEVVEANDFLTQDRSGFVAGFMWLEAGSYQIVQVEDREVVATIGGAAETIADGAGSDCGHTDIVRVATEADGAPFSVPTSGLYKVTHDQMTGELIMYNINDASVIGSATEGGWSADTPMSAIGDITADGAVWEATEVLMRSGEWKVRFNCNWGINRRIDPNGSLNDASNGYQLFTNFGGSVNNLDPGGSNIQQTEDAFFTVRLEWSPRDGFFLTQERTGDAPTVTFNPNDFQMAVIGDATANGWDADRNLFHKEEGGVHTWYGVVTFADSGAFKFRANDEWNFDLGGPDLTNLGIGGNGANIDSPGAGAYYITLSTADEGSTWSATVNELAWAVIGAGGPNGDWENDVPMESSGFDAGISTYTLTGDFTTDAWKFRAGRAWQHNIGGDLTFLTVDGSDIVLTDPGTYTVTLSFNGEVYSATVQ